MFAIGDSIAAGYNGETRKDKDGWPQQLGLDDNHALGISGSTAEEWATIYVPILKKVVRSAVPSGEPIVISLVGNDFIAAVGDGILSGGESTRMVEAYKSVLHRLRLCRCYIILYTDPTYGADPEIACQVRLLRQLLMAVPDRRAFPAGLSWYDLDSIIGFEPGMMGDDKLHPSTKGHEAIARHMAFMGMTATF